MKGDPRKYRVGTRERPYYPRTKPVLVTDHSPVMHHSMGKLELICVYHDAKGHMCRKKFKEHYRQVPVRPPFDP